MGERIAERTRQENINENEERKKRIGASGDCKWLVLRSTLNTLRAFLTPANPR